MRALRPALWRELGIAHRAGPVERATQHVLDALWALKALARARRDSLRGGRCRAHVRIRRASCQSRLSFASVSTRAQRCASRLSVIGSFHSLRTASRTRTTRCQRPPSVRPGSRRAATAYSGRPRRRATAQQPLRRGHPQLAPRAMHDVGPAFFLRIRCDVASALDPPGDERDQDRGGEHGGRDRNRLAELRGDDAKQVNRAPSESDEREECDEDRHGESEKRTDRRMHRADPSHGITACGECRASRSPRRCWAARGRP